MFEISQFAEKDTEQWHVLWAGYQEDEDISPEEAARQVSCNWPRILEDEKCHSLALRLKDTGQAVGFANFEVQWTRDDDRDRCYLCDLFVLPEFQGNGGGRMLIEAVVSYAKEKNLKQVYWITQPHNEQAQKLYESFGDSETWLKYKVSL